MDDYHKIQKYYNRYGSHYELERNRTYYYDIINTIEIGTLMSYAKNAKVLEIGCGTGIILESSHRLAKMAVGIDLSLGMLSDSKKKGLNIINANAVMIPFKDESFDVVYSFKALPHIPDIEDVIREIHRLLKAGGWAILEFYNPWSFKYITNAIMGSKYKVFTQFHTPTDVFQLTRDYFSPEKIIGARTITPVVFFLKVPIVGRFLRRLEYRLSKTHLNRFSGYQVFVLKKI